jgi:hypothetical protein
MVVPFWWGAPDPMSGPGRGVSPGGRWSYALIHRSFPSFAVPQTIRVPAVVEPVAPLGEQYAPGCTVDVFVRLVVGAGALVVVGVCVGIRSTVGMIVGCWVVGAVGVVGTVVDGSTGCGFPLVLVVEQATSVDAAIPTMVRISLLAVCFLMIPRVRFRCVIY